MESEFQNVITKFLFSPSIYTQGSYSTSFQRSFNANFCCMTLLNSVLNPVLRICINLMRICINLMRIRILLFNSHFSRFGPTL
jgi:hypothetical protein